MLQQRRLCVWQPNNSLDFIDTWSPPTSSSSTHSPLVLEWTVWCSWTVQFFVMFDMFGVRFWAKMWCSKVFEVRSCCYMTRLVLEHIVWCSRTVWFFVMFDMFEVLFWDKMWCSESPMFGVFEVQYFAPFCFINNQLSNTVSQKAVHLKRSQPLVRSWKSGTYSLVLLLKL